MLEVDTHAVSIGRDLFLLWFPTTSTGQARPLFLCTYLLTLIYIIMGLINNIKDAFKKTEFTVAPNKKLKTISADFKKAFDLSLVFYKGAIIAEGDLTLNQLGKKTTKEVNTTADGILIKGSTKVGEAEKMFDKAFGVTVQIKDKSGKVLVPNEITIGQAARGEYK